MAQVTKKDDGDKYSVKPGGSIDLGYTVLEASSDLDASAALEAAAPLYYYGLLRQEYTMTGLGNGAYDCTVHYGPRPILQPGSGEIAQDGGGSLPVFSFDTTGGRAKITQSLATLGAYAPDGLDAPLFGGAIGVNGQSIEGCDVVVPALKFSLKYRFYLASLTLAYLRTLYVLTGVVNAGMWKGFPPGEILFTGATGEQTGGMNPEVTFHFEGSANAVMFDRGGITIAAKGGHDYLWFLYQTGISGSKQVKTPRAAYVEMVYPRGNLGLLGIGL